MPRSFLLLALAALPLLAPRPASAQVQYTLTPLGTLGGNSSYAEGINASGEVVGEATTSAGATHAFLYSNGTMTDLGTLPGGLGSQANAINSGAEIVGASDTATYAHAFLYSNGTMTDLGVLPGGITSVATGHQRRRPDRRLC